MDWLFRGEGGIGRKRNGLQAFHVLRHGTSANEHRNRQDPTIVSRISVLSVVRPSIIGGSASYCERLSRVLGFLRHNLCTSPYESIFTRKEFHDIINLVINESVATWPP